MARIAGVPLNDNKHLEIALTGIYGIGRSTAREICAKLGLAISDKLKDLSEDTIEALRTIIDKEYVVEGNLRSQKKGDLSRLKQIGCNRYRRLKNGLPVNGQRSHTNAQTCKKRKQKID